MVDIDAFTGTVSVALANGLAGLLLAAIAFPVRWGVEAWRHRRQAVVTAARQARVELRRGRNGSRGLGQLAYTVLHARTDGPPPPTPTEALDQVCWLLAEQSDRRLYDLAVVATSLYSRGHVVPAMYGRGEVNAQEAVLDVVDDALQIRIRYALRGLRPIAKRIDQLQDLIRAAELEAEERIRLAWKVEPEAEEEG